MSRAPEVLVIGGGPAGASAARLLAHWGHAVTVVARVAGQARLAVSLPPSCHKVFEAIDVSDAVERAAFTRSSGNTVWWGSREPRVETFAAGLRGWQVEAHLFEAMMLGHASAAGATVERRTFSETEIAGGGAFVLDCSGRSGVLARAMGVRRYDEGPRTVALVAVWQRAGAWPVPDDSHTLIESYDTGWAWSVPARHGARHVALMVDPQRSGLARGASAREIYRAELAKTQQFRLFTADASMTGGPWGWDASTYRADRYAGDGWLLVGDAGSFIDPLSSAGVKKAMASGWLAAIVAHTSLARPAMRQHALDFFSAREHEMVDAHATASRRFLADAAPSHQHPFWSERAKDSVSGDAEPAGPDDDLRAAFERLRQAPTLNVSQNPALRIEPRPTISGREIVLAPHLVTPDRPSGIRHLRGVDLLMLVRLAPTCSQVPDLFDAYCRRAAPVALPDFLHVLATALCRRWIMYNGRKNSGIPEFDDLVT